MIDDEDFSDDSGCCCAQFAFSDLSLIRTRVLLGSYLIATSVLEYGTRTCCESLIITAAQCGWWRMRAASTRIFFPPGSVSLTVAHLLAVLDARQSSSSSWRADSCDASDVVAVGRTHADATNTRPPAAQSDEAAANMETKPAKALSLPPQPSLVGRSSASCSHLRIANCDSEVGEELDGLERAVAAVTGERERGE